ncbi:MAG: threonine ammonia-lyase [Ponticaulis sp.]|nr:threonine ammonia-lyase [Ponticaulis sp.]
MLNVTETPLSLDDVRAAAKVIDGHVERTPMRMSRTLSQITGAEVWIKFENFQFTASFKERGALNRLMGLSEEEKKRGVIAMSAGNHAQGVAYHGQSLGIPVTIVMPENTPFVKVQHTRNYGARVILKGDGIAEANQHARQVCHDENLVFIHPFDDKLVMAGQGTIALEMLEDVSEPFDELVIPVGGGGLISGMATAAKALQPGIKITGVEVQDFPALYNQLRQESPRPGGSTIAEGIAVKTVGERNFEVCERLVDRALLVSEDAIERAITLYATVEKTIAEGAGAAGLAALLSHPEHFRGKRIGLVLCGGNIDTRLLASVLTRSLVRDQRLVNIRIIGDDRPGLLAKVSKLIGDVGANIIEVAHNRLALDVPAKGAEFDILIETRDAQHTQEVVEALTAAGYPPRKLA